VFDLRCGIDNMTHLPRIELSILYGGIEAM
jgi:hypothetical protein